MTLPASPNPISLSQVNTELTRSATATISMNEAAVRELFGVASGAIAMSNGHGKSSQFVFSFGGGTNVDLRTAAINAGWNQLGKLIATNTGYISSASTGAYALTISGSFPNGVEFINNGVILGRGGDGGAGGSIYTGVVQGVGASGGPALLVATAVTVSNNGTISGGGGGGGGGGRSSIGRGQYVSGGGGGGGLGVSSGGAGGEAMASYAANFGQPGVGGTLSAPGGGGLGGSSVGTPVPGSWGANGGSGGVYGSSGGSGTTPTTGSFVEGGAGGGSGGAAVAGNGWITWTAFGSRYGGIT